MTDAFYVHGLAAMKQQRRKPRRAEPVTVIKVLPIIWEHAMQAANGDGTRIKIISATEVLVTNRSRA